MKYKDFYKINYKIETHQKTINVSDIELHINRFHAGVMCEIVAFLYHKNVKLLYEKCFKIFQHKNHIIPFINDNYVDVSIGIISDFDDAKECLLKIKDSTYYIIFTEIDDEWMFAIQDIFPAIDEPKTMYQADEDYEIKYDDMWYIALLVGQIDAWIIKPFTEPKKEVNQLH